MKLIDTHAHLFSEEFQEDIDAVVARAKEAGVYKVLLPNIDEITIGPLKETADRYPGFFCPMMGLHPTSVQSHWKHQLDEILAAAESISYVGVGEIGIDLHWNSSTQAIQTDAFEAQLKWSIEKDLPVSIHFRNALEEVVRSIQRVGEKRLKGVFHSFGGNKADLDTILQLQNFCVGINGVVTFKNGGVAETLKHCPRDRVVLETDAPYLAPVPFRGKRNESSYLSFINQKLSEAWEISMDETAYITSSNASALFDLDHPKSYFIKIISTGGSI